MEVKREGIYVLGCFLVLVAVFKILFFKESLLVVLRTVFSLFWLFVIPGFMLMYYWADKLDFVERLIIGSVMGFAIMSVIGYNLGLIGVRMGIQLFVVPLICIAIGAFVLKKRA